MSNLSLYSRFVIRNALLASRLSKKVGNRLSIHGISLTEYLVMHLLEATSQKAVPRIDLADQLGMSASGVTRLVAPMEKIGLIEKESNPRDARQSLVKLSAAGRRLYAEAGVSFEDVSDELTGNLSHGQMEKILDLYTRII